MLQVEKWTSLLQSDNTQVLEKALNSFAELSCKIATEAVDNEVSEESAFLKSWFKTSPNCSELLRVWIYTTSNSVTTLDSVLDCLGYALISSRLVGYWAVGTNLSKTIISNHLKDIYNNLASEKQSLVISTLKLLLSMASHGGSVTRLLMDSFDFTSKTFTGLLKRRKLGKPTGKMLEDIRSLMIKFILAFITNGDTLVKSSLLSVKNLYTAIFIGIKDDNYETVQFILSILQTNIVDDLYLSRTIKIGFFPRIVLDNLVPLYSFKSLDSPRVVSPSNPNQTIADIVHAFFMHISTTPGVGICFSDLGWYPAVFKNNPIATIGTTHTLDSGTGAHQFLQQPKIDSGKVYNRALLRLITSLKLSDDMRQRELFLGILAACPELVHSFWASCTASLSFEPRSSTRYLSNTTMALAMIRLPVPTEFLGKLSTTILAPPPLENALSNILPPLLSRALIARALQHSSRDIRFACSSLLSGTLEKYTQVINETDEIIFRLNASGVVNASAAIQMWKKWVMELSQQLRHQMPDVQMVISLQQNVDRQEEEDSTSLDDLRIAALSFIRGFQRHFPELFRESRFDFGKLIPPTLSEESVDYQKAVVLVLKEIYDFKVLTKYPKSKWTHFVTLIRIATQSNDSDLVKEILNLLNSTLNQNFCFQDYPDYFLVIVDLLSVFPLEQRIILIEYLDNAFCSCNQNCMMISDTISRLTQEAELNTMPLHSVLQSNAMDVDLLDTKKPKSTQFVFPFPPILMSLIRTTLKECGFGLTTLFVASCVQATFAMSTSLFSIKLFHRLLYDDHWPDNALQSSIMPLCKYWVRSVIADLSNDNEPLDFNSKDTSIGWKEGKAMIKQFISSNVSPAINAGFVCKYATKIVTSFKSQHNSLGVYIQVCSPLPDASLMLHLIESGDSEFFTSNHLAVIPNIFGPFAMDALADHSIIQSYFVNLFSQPISLENTRLYLLHLGSLLLWTNASVQKSKSFKAIESRVKLCLKLVSVTLKQSILTENNACRRAVISMIFNHSLILHLFLNSEDCSTVSLLCHIQATDEFQVDLYVEKFWIYVESLINLSATASESSTITDVALQQFQSGASTLMQFLNADDIKSRIMVLIQQSDRNRLQDEILFTLISTYISVEKSRSRTCVKMQGELFKALLLALTCHHAEAEKLITQFIGNPQDDIKNIQHYSISGELAVGMKSQDLNITLNADVPLDIWSVLTPESLVSSIKAFNNDDLWNFATKNAVASIPHALHLLQFFKKKASSKKFKKVQDGKTSLQIRSARVVRAIIQAWTVVSNHGCGKIQWLDNIVSEHTLLLADVAVNVADLELKTIESCLTGVSLDCDQHQSTLTAFPAFALLFDNSLPSDWLPSLVSRVLKTTIKSLELSTSTLIALWPMFINLSDQYTDVPFGDLALFVIHSVYSQKKREAIDSPLKTSLSTIVAWFASSEQSLALTTIQNIALVKAVFMICLKFRFTDPCAMLLLKHLVIRFYPSTTTPAGLLSAPNLVNMITSHSQFDDVMEPIATPGLEASLRSSPIPQNSESKFNLLQLLQCIMEVDPTQCCLPEYLPKIVRSYYGTLSPCDRATLSLLFIYETHAFISISPYIGRWGAIQTDKLNSNALHQHTYADPIAPINSRWMARSLGWFSVGTEMDSFADVSAINPSNPNDTSRFEVHSSSLAYLYDPNFILPLVAGALSSINHPLDLLCLIESNALGLVIMALSSKSDATRRLAHFILCKTYAAIRDSDLTQRNQLMILLQSLKNIIIPISSIKNALPDPIPASMAAFFAHALIVLLKPEGVMFQPIYRFLLYRPLLEMRSIPLLNILFFSSSDSNVRERMWILRVLSAGLKSTSDYRLYQHKHVIEILMSYFHSSMADTGTRKMVLEILFKATNDLTVVATMVIRSGLLGFLEGCCIQLDTSEVSEIMLSLSVLVHRILCCFNTAMMSWTESGRSGAHLWIAQMARLTNILVSRLLEIKNGSGQRYANLVLRILQVVQAVTTISSNAGVSICILGIESIEQLFMVTKSLCPTANLLDPSVNLTRLDSDDNNRLLQDSSSIASTADVDFLFSFKKLSSHKVYQEATRSFFSILGNINVSPKLERDQFVLVVRQFENLVDHFCFLFDVYQLEHIVAWIVRCILESSAEDSLVLYLVRDAPSTFYGVLRVLFTGLDAGYSPQGYTCHRLWHLSLAGIVMIARSFTPVDSKHSETGKLDDWRVRILTSVMPKLTPFVQSPRSLLSVPIASTIDLPTPSYEAVKLGQLLRLAICASSSDTIIAWKPVVEFSK
ncbi:hypothetical protein QVD99_007419 [Batrachochytrium dendrobatidis]|nr:hypothetical protein QVD99_007419 [Batrachochytrium dendrobatidis]